MDTANIKNPKKNQGLRMAEKSEERDQNLKIGINKNRNKTMNVLLIEDNPGDVRLIQEMVRKTQNSLIHLEIHDNLTQGIRSLVQNEFQAILLDLSLPDSYGLETIERMLEKANGIPIIILTGTDDQLLAIEAVKSGAQDYLIKGSINSVFLERAIYYSIERQNIKEKLKQSEEKYRRAYLQANFYKDIFAHDMSNILQGIISAIQLCNLQSIKSANQRNLEVASEIIETQVERGSKLISNVRKLSQLEDSNESIRSIGLSILLKKSIMNLKNAFHTRSINIQINSQKNKIFAQANDLLQDIFDNILINAVRHNQNSTVEIFINISNQEEKGINFIKMEFIDNGIGIDDSRKEIIFLRGSKEDKDLSGMGLGLSLVSKIIESYKGKIWVEDKIEGDYTKGSNFIILIPEVI